MCRYTNLSKFSKRSFINIIFKNIKHQEIYIQKVIQALVYLYCIKKIFLHINVRFIVKLRRSPQNIFPSNNEELSCLHPEILNSVGTFPCFYRSTSTYTKFETHGLFFSSTLSNNWNQWIRFWLLLRPSHISKSKL